MQGILTRNYRDIHTISPKILLLDIRNDDGTEFRDHCWINASEVELFIPKTNRYKSTIYFTAASKTYQTRGPEKITLVGFKDITVVKKKKELVWLSSKQET